MRNRIFAVFAIAILAGGALAYGTYNFMQAGPVQAVSMPDPARRRGGRRSAARHRISKDDLQVVQFPEGAVPEGRSRSRPNFGRGLIVSVVKNEPILPRSWRRRKPAPGCRRSFREGMRAVSVRVNEVIGVAGYVLPGTRVDVVATASPTEARRIRPRR